MTNDPMTKEARIPNDEVAETAIVLCASCFVILSSLGLSSFVLSVARAGTGFALEVNR
jgi:hypothetical protein